MKGYKKYNGGWIFESSHHLEIQLSKKEVHDFLSKNGGFFFVNCYDFDSENQTNYWYIIKDTADVILDLKPKVRNQVRKAIKTFDISLISKSEIMTQGYNAYISSYSRYESPGKIMSEINWKSYIKDCSNNYEYWAVKDKVTGEILAYSENLVFDQSVKYVGLKANPKSLKQYPFYGLIFMMNEYYLDKMKYKYVSDGRKTLSQHSAIQEFLCNKLNFRKAYTNIKIYYPFYIKILIKLTYPFRNCRFLPQKLKMLLRLEESTK